MNGVHEHTAQESNNLMLGKLGVDYVATPGTTVTGAWWRVFAPAADSVVNITTSIGDNLSGYLLKVGIPLEAPITSITLIAGSFVATRG